MQIQADSNMIQKRISSIQRELGKLGPMRPGCLTVQYRKPREKAGAYFQLSYTYKGESRTEYIPAELVPAIEEELAHYKRFRELCAQWVDLNLELSLARINAWKQAQKSN